MSATAMSATDLSASTRSATARKSLRTPDDLVRANLAGGEQLQALGQVAARYAVAITPDLDRKSVV